METRTTTRLSTVIANKLYYKQDVQDKTKVIHITKTWCRPYLTPLNVIIHRIHNTNSNNILNRNIL